MILFIHTKKDYGFLDSIIFALNGYFSNIVVNDDANRDASDVQIIIHEDKIVLNQRETTQEFIPPFKIGNILQKIQISLQNERAQKTAAPIMIGPHILYPDSNIIEMRKKKISLTDKEFDIILKIFQSSPNSIARDELLKEIWGYNNQIETHTLETHIYRLRQKIEQDPANPDFLITNDDGYYFNI